MRSQTRDVRRDFATGILARLPGYARLVAFFARVARTRVRDAPLGLVALLPVAIAIDFFDVFDEIVPVAGTAASFVVESAFLMALTGSPIRSLGFAGLDLIPLVDTIPFATLAVLRRLAEGLSPEARNGAPTMETVGTVT